FFLCIGLELKYEILRGQLKNIRAVSLPIFGALGGMITPALIFIAINYSHDFAMKGWAIPTATDIAFAVGILMLLGNKIPTSLKLFLLSLAIFDDLGAIVIIALFYTD
ncbi:TPA: Na+/H+ antiporter NhaA, partial [Campylobacter jejuni]|nr:Na+/H+ antiporter NhaA [Campylobacter jejuni]